LAVAGADKEGVLALTVSAAGRRDFNSEKVFLLILPTVSKLASMIT